MPFWIFDLSSKRKGTKYIVLFILFVAECFVNQRRTFVKISGDIKIANADMSNENAG